MSDAGIVQGDGAISFRSPLLQDAGSCEKYLEGCRRAIERNAGGSLESLAEDFDGLPTLPEVDIQLGLISIIRVTSASASGGWDRE